LVLRFFVFISINIVMVNLINNVIFMSNMEDL
jgi:hypothetical protein